MFNRDCARFVLLTPCSVCRLAGTVKAMSGCDVARSAHGTCTQAHASMHISRRYARRCNPAFLALAVRPAVARLLQLIQCASHVLEPPEDKSGNGPLTRARTCSCTSTRSPADSASAAASTPSAVTR